MKLGIIGCRKRDSDDEYIKLKSLFKEILTHKKLSDITIVSGGCPKGGDRFAEILANEYDLPICIFYPDKSKMTGNSKGEYTKICYARNLLIAENSDELIAMVAPERRGGTENTIKSYIKLKNKNPILI